MTAENKVDHRFTYYNNETHGAQVQSSFGIKRNGRVFSEHPFVNVVKSLVNKYESDDIDVLASYFTNDSKFYKLGGGDPNSYNAISLEDRIEIWKRQITANPKRRMEIY